MPGDSPTGELPGLGLFTELSELDDRELAVGLLAELAEVPRDGNIGLVHGDFELDDLAWSGGSPTAFDFDDAAVSWFRTRPARSQGCR